MQSKLRPVVTRNVAYHKPHYERWLNKASLLLIEQWEGKPKLVKVGKVSVQFYGVKNCDLDNAIGAVFDAMTRAEIWTDDRIVQHLEAAFEPSKAHKIEIWIELR